VVGPYGFHSGLDGIDLKLMLPGRLTCP
jgi:hypothetical protein